MAVDNPAVIDMVTTVRTTGEVVLVITNHLRWSDENHLEVLQAKINGYLAYIESGQLAESYPNAKVCAPVRIEVACKYRPRLSGIPSSLGGSGGRVGSFGDRGGGRDEADG